MKVQILAFFHGELDMISKDQNVEPEIIGNVRSATKSIANFKDAILENDLFQTLFERCLTIRNAIRFYSNILYKKLEGINLPEISFSHRLKSRERANNIKIENLYTGREWSDPYLKDDDFKVIELLFNFKAKGFILILVVKDWFLLEVWHALLAFFLYATEGNFILAQKLWYNLLFFSYFNLIFAGILTFGCLGNHFVILFFCQFVHFLYQIINHRFDYIETYIESDVLILSSLL